MFRVKICGITNSQDAAAAVRAGADAIGLNFFSGSRRCIRRETAERIVATVQTGAAKVGVFVNAPAAEIRTLAAALQLDFVQLHGDEPPEAIAELADLRVIRAFRLGPMGWAPCRDYLARCAELGLLPSALLIDAHQPGEYGGTGESPDWSLVRTHRELALGLPVILAGGLKPENVAQAIAAVEPHGVDTASGVESAPGVKDPAKVASFIAAATQALLQVWPVR